MRDLHIDPAMMMWHYAAMTDGAKECLAVRTLSLVPEERLQIVVAGENLPNSPLNDRRKISTHKRTLNDPRIPSRQKNTKPPSVKPKSSKTSSKATSPTSDLYCPVIKATGKSRSKATSKVPRSVKNPSKNPSKKLTSTKSDVCNREPAPIPTKAVNVCDDLIDCQLGDESEPIIQDSYKPYKSKIKKPTKSKGGKSIKSIKPTKAKGAKAGKRQEQFSVDLFEFDPLAKRGEPRRYKTNVEGASKLHLYSQAYPSNSDLYTGDGKDVPKVQVQWRNDKFNDVDVRTYRTVPSDNVYKELVTEHLIGVNPCISDSPLL